MADKPRNDWEISRREIKAHHLLGRNPAEFVMNRGARFAIEDRAKKGLQFDGAVSVVVDNRVEWLAHRDDHAELLFDFSPKAERRSLAGFDLPARELLFSRKPAR